MKKLISILLCCVLLFGMAACKKPAPTQAANELLSLGEKYLLELDYEQALVQFLKVIEIEPMNARAITGAVSSYVGRGTAAVLGGESEASLARAQADFEAALALDEKSEDAWLSLIDVYIRRGDYNKALELAKEALEKTGGESVKAKLEELESGNISDSQNQIRMRTGYDGNGALTFWHEYTYNEKGQQNSITSYDAGGSQTGHVDMTYDENGNRLRSFSYITQTGEVMLNEYSYNEHNQATKIVRYGIDGTRGTTNTRQYNAAGQMIRVDIFSSDDVLSSYELYEYNSNGQQSKRSIYEPNGGLRSYFVPEYNEHGVRVKNSYYNKDGVLQWYEVSRYNEDGQSIGSDRYEADGTLTSSTVNE